MKKVMLIAILAAPFFVNAVALAQDNADAAAANPPKKTKKTIKKSDNHKMATTDKSDTKNDRDPPPIPPANP